MGDLDYVYAVARIRVKEKSLLTDADIRQMIALPDAKSALSYLIDKGWGDEDSGGDMDRILEAEERKTTALMKELGLDLSMLDALTLPQLYHNLKAAIKQTLTEDNPAGLFYDIDPYGEAQMMKIIKDHSYDELPDHMRKAAAEAYEVMLRTRDGQRCDSIVDRACMEAMIEAGKHSGSDLIREYTESTVAVSDIKIAARAQKTGKSVYFLREALAPCRALDVSDLAAAASKTEETLMQYLQTHGFKEAAEAWKESPSAFERWCDDRLIETIRPQKKNPFSSGPLVAYYLARQNEIRTVRILLTAKANGFSEEETRERVRQMYV